jgi:dolichol-phosphate mannosyltransferase
MEPTFSIVVPVFNERESLPELYRRVKETMESTGEVWELIFVDDGSQDGSTEIIRNLGKQDQHVRSIIFARNFGHQIAITAGLDYSQGRAVVVMDSDLQDPPEVVLDLIAKWREGYQVAYAVRAEREGETWFKKTTASLFYRIIYRITDVKIPLDTGDFRLMDRQVVEVLKKMRERHRFPRGMVAWVGFRQAPVPYRRAARFAGTTKYPFKKMFKLALDAVTSFSYFPLQVASYVGFTAAGVSIIAIPVVIVMRLFGHQAFLGQASTLLAVLFLGGVQLICVGVLGEYIGRIYDEVKGRPLYIVSEAPQTSNSDQIGLNKNG